MTVAVRTLDAILQHAETNEALHRSDLRSGDQVVVATENSIYSISVADNSSYAVRGGWFDRQGPTPVRTSILGCTWGGSVLMTGVVAAVGLRLEFADRLVTSPIRGFLVIRAEENPGEGAVLARHDEAVLSSCGIRWEAELPVS